MFKIGLYIFIKIQVDVTTYKVNCKRLKIKFVLFLSQWHARHTNEL
jgi:hypothetical protein